MTSAIDRGLWRKSRRPAQIVVAPAAAQRQSANQLADDEDDDGRCLVCLFVDHVIDFVLGVCCYARACIRDSLVEYVWILCPVDVLWFVSHVSFQCTFGAY